jgi:hypothetical protein
MLYMKVKKVTDPELVDIIIKDLRIATPEDLCKAYKAITGCPATYEGEGIYKVVIGYSSKKED